MSARREPPESTPAYRTAASSFVSYVIAALSRAGGFVSVATGLHVGPVGPVKYRHVSWEVPVLVAPPKRRTEVDPGRYVIEWLTRAAGAGLTEMSAQLLLA